MEFIKGMTWGWVGQSGTWTTGEATASMSAMKELGVNWTAIAFIGVQDHPSSTDIRFNEGFMVRDDEVRFAVENAHRLGLKVCLKPVVNCVDGTWRAYINFNDNPEPHEPTWEQWFDSYNRFILHYAEIAEETGCEMFCVGCEMVSADRRESEWRSLISRVRTVYRGPITYNCNHHQEEKISWWDAVDIVSTSAYYPESEWKKRVPQLRKIAAKLDKPVFFMEVGCPSRTGSASKPYDWQHQGATNVEEQARFYRTMFDAMKEETWFYGYMLWDWPALLYPIEEAHKNDGYCIYGKPAADVVRRFYAER